MTCGSAAAPCIHAQNCHHYRAVINCYDDDDRPVAQLLVSLLKSGEFIVQKVGNTQPIMKRFGL